MRKEINEVDVERALKLRERDARARALAMSCVNYAMREEPPTEVPPEARRYAHDVATLATALLVSAIYLEDAEIRALVEERDRYRELTLQGMQNRPRVFIQEKPR